jgi:hypothetical protein
MKKIATTILLACAFLGAGCSDSTTVTTAATPAPATPVPMRTPTEEEQQAAIRNSAEADKAAEQRKLEENGRTEAATAVLPGELTEAIAVEPDAQAAARPTPTP